ncbi:hypothetical protein Deia_00010 [Candidatus Deianiraea vastatrix]|uniref:Uncharacterized protein n=2 Tax=Candidatus Deianiraea vastatrix TaxID=2163644 RepID=A0A5B8XEJ3_9RICK|nr:hypothetical protein Deia_00010 [Candidatus Deianiraea vastatrix]
MGDAKLDYTKDVSVYKNEIQDQLQQINDAMIKLTNKLYSAGVITHSVKNMIQNVDID